MTWKRLQAAPERKPFKAIKCLTCEQELPGRASLKQHMNHNVVYVNLDGSYEL